MQPGRPMTQYITDSPPIPKPGSTLNRAPSVATPDVFSFYDLLIRYHGKLGNSQPFAHGGS